MVTTPTGPEFVKNTGQSGAKSGDHTQPTLFAMQVALEASMRAYGVRPGAPGNFFTTTPP